MTEKNIRGLALALALAGCAPDHGLVDVGQPYLAADGSSVQMVAGRSEGVTGLGLVQTRVSPLGHPYSGVVGWSAAPRSPGPIETLLTAIAAGGVAGAVGGRLIGNSFPTVP